MIDISVIMSIYNGESYLKKSIDSILSQTYQNFEFIIINDGSTDNTKNILNDYRNYERIKVIDQDNIGLTKSLNKGIHLAKGKYIARMDCDDISFKKRLEAQKKFLDKNKDCAVVGTYYKEINGVGEIISKIKYKDIYNYDHIKEKLVKGNIISHSSVMFRKDLIIKEGLYDENIPYGQDYDLWVRLAKNYRINIIPKCLHYYRKTKNNISNKKRKKQLYYAVLSQFKAIRYFGKPIDFYYLLKNIIKLIIV